MKPIESHKDSRITNISFDNFTGSICIITPLSDNDEDDDQTKDLMLSTPQTNGGTNLFQSNQYGALITQPILVARSRKKNSNDSVTNSRRSSLNETSSLTSSNNRLEKILLEKRTSHTESIDSGLDFSLSTNSSIQQPLPPPPPTHILIHRPLSALNEDSNIDDGFQEQSTRLLRANPGDIGSKENVNNNHTNAVLNHSEKSTKKSHDTSIQQHQSSNDLNDLTKSKKSSRKKTKLNIIVEPSISRSSSTRFTVHDESLQSKPRPNMKPKAITPLGHYPNPEQIRAHINRSVIERQHLPYLSNLPRKNFVQSQQHSNAFDTLKTKQFSFRQQKSQNRNSQGEISTLQHLHITPSYRTKQALPSLHNEDIIDNYREKKYLNKCQENIQKDLFQRQKDHSRESVKTNQQECGDHFLTSTPRLHHPEYDQSIGITHKKPNVNHQHPFNLPQRFKPTVQTFQHKNRTTNYNGDFPTEHLSRNGNHPLQFQSKKILRASNLGFTIEQYHPLNQRQKSPTESINSSFRTNRNHPLNMNNFQLTKRNSTQLNPIQLKTHRFFPTKSPVTKTFPSDQFSSQTQQHDPNESSSSSSSSTTANDFIDEKSSRTNQSTGIDDQEPLDGRYVIPSHHSPLPSSTNSPSHPFTSISRLTITHDTNNHEELINRQNSSSSPSSLDRISPIQQSSFPLGKVTVEIENNDLSTNYDSDDGWSNDSAELIYVDERYRTQKKKSITSSSQVLTQQSLAQHHVQQNLLLR